MASAARKLTPVTDEDTEQDKREPNPLPSKPAAEIEAAKGEVIEDDSIKTVEWQGLTFAIPPELPAVALLDQVEMETSQNLTAMIRLLHTVLGVDQYHQARNRVVELSDKTMENQVENIVDLVNTVFNAYGVDEGESSEPAA